MMHIFKIGRNEFHVYDCDKLKHKTNSREKAQEYIDELIHKTNSREKAQKYIEELFSKLNLEEWK